MRVAVVADGAAVCRIQLRAGASGQTLLTREGVRDLASALDEADFSAACRVIIIEGTAGSFCHGMDISYLIAHPEADVTEEAGVFAGCLNRLRESTKIVLSVVDGPALGGGVGLVAASDIAIASSRASFGLPETVLGLIPAIILPLIQERMPAQKARLLALSTNIDAERALSLGLIDHLVADPERLERRVRQVVKHLLRTCPEAVAGLKALSGQIAGMARAEALRVGVERTAAMISDRERLAALSAFFDGEPLPWFETYRPAKRTS